MDAIVKRLVPTESLKTTFLSSVAGRRVPLFLNYDDEADTIMLLLQSPAAETVVHYVNDDVALLYTPDHLEIVGLQIEDFQSEFVPMHNALKEAWRLSDSGVRRGNLRDLTVATQGKQISVALEVVRAAQPLIGPPAKQIERALEYA